MHIGKERFQLRSRRSTKSRWYRLTYENRSIFVNPVLQTCQRELVKDQEVEDTLDLADVKIGHPITRRGSGLGILEQGAVPPTGEPPVNVTVRVLSQRKGLFRRSAQEIKPAHLVFVEKQGTSGVSSYWNPYYGKTLFKLPSKGVLVDVKEGERIRQERKLFVTGVSGVVHAQGSLTPQFLSWRRGSGTSPRPPSRDSLPTLLYHTSGVVTPASRQLYGRFSGSTSALPIHATLTGSLSPARPSVVDLVRRRSVHASGPPSPPSKVGSVVIPVPSSTTTRTSLGRPAPTRSFESDSDTSLDSSMTASTRPGPATTASDGGGTQEGKPEDYLEQLAQAVYDIVKSRTKSFDTLQHLARWLLPDEPYPPEVIVTALPEDEFYPSLVFEDHWDDGVRPPDIALLGPDPEFPERTAVMAATFWGMLSYATAAVNEGSPTVFREVLCLAYPSFVTQQQFLSLLIRRFLILPTLVWEQLCLELGVPELAGEEHLRLLTNRIKSGRLRVYNIIKYWITELWPYDFEDQPLMVRRIQQFVNLGSLSRLLPAQSKSLQQLLARKLSPPLQSRKFVFDAPPPPSLAAKGKLDPTKFDYTRLKALSPIEVARQLSLMEQALYQTIRPRELLGQAWVKNRDLARNVIAFIHQFNWISYWVITTILSKERESSRIKVITFFVRVAEYLYTPLNNFNTCMAILTALNAAPIKRLRLTWSEIKDDHYDVWCLYRKLDRRLSSDRNFARFRARLSQVAPPTVPYLGMFLTDLTFIEDGVPERANYALLPAGLPLPEELDSGPYGEKRYGDPEPLPPSQLMLHTGGPANATTGLLLIPRSKVLLATGKDVPPGAPVTAPTPLPLQRAFHTALRMGAYCELLNVTRIGQVTAVIRTVQRYQYPHYNLAAVPGIQAWIRRQIDPEQNPLLTQDEDVLYDRSTALEEPDEVRSIELLTSGDDNISDSELDDE